MRIFVTYARNFDQFYSYDHAIVRENSFTYKTPVSVNTHYGVYEGIDWHADRVSAAKRLMLNRNAEIRRLQKEADRLRALPDEVEIALAEVTAEARAA